ncbi:MAG: signal transduction histidine kinase [Planctomycetota bacterium]|jgi:signal transduction histidine kinase
MGDSDGLRGVLDDARMRSLIRELGYALAHDVGGPASKVSGFAALLREDLGTELDEQAAESLGCLVTSAEELSMRLCCFLDWCRLPEEPEQSVRVPVADLLQQVAEAEPQLRAQATGQTLELCGDPQLLARLLRELLRNAVLYGKTDEPIVSVSQDSAGISFEVRDGGPGLSAERRQLACLPFRRFVGASNPPGAGMGLAIAERIARLHGGSLALRDAQPGLVVRVEFY